MGLFYNQLATLVCAVFAAVLTLLWPMFVDYAEVFDILFLLAKSEGGMQRIELARALYVSPSNLTYALNYLLEKEYITQSEHECGKKEPYFITDAGLKKLKRELPHSSFVKRV